MIGSICRSALRQNCSKFIRAVAPGSSKTCILPSSAVYSGSGSPVRSRFLSTTPARFSLADVLSQEIAAETELAAKQTENKVTAVPGWNANNKEALVELSKQHGSEKLAVIVDFVSSIVVSFNVNHSLEGEGDELNPADQEGGINTVTPNFRVEVKRGGESLVFECEPMPADETGGAPFIVVELYMYKGEEPSDDCYSTSGQIIDAALYDQFLVYLDERGVNEALLNAIDQYVASYEHQLYLGLLKGVKQFVGA